MFGILFGMACIFGLVMVLKKGHLHGGGCGRGRGDRHRRGWRSFGPLGFLFDRIDATTEQERTIRDAVDEFMRDARDAKSEAKDTRKDVAKAMRADYFDETLLGELFARHDTVLEKLRKGALGSLAKIHESLDPRQRERLADLIESGGWRRWA